MKWHIASVSWGKDSLAMLLMLIAKGYPLNEVVFYDTGMEFEAIYHTRDQMLPRLEQLGIKYTRLEPENPFLFDMLERPVCSKQKVRNTFNVAIAEYGTEDSLTRLRLMVISLSNSEQHLQSRMDKCLAMMEAVCSEEMVYSDLEFINGD